MSDQSSFINISQSEKSMQNYQNNNDRHQAQLTHQQLQQSQKKSQGLTGSPGSSNALQLTDQNRKMIKQIKDKQYKQGDGATKGKNATIKYVQQSHTPDTLHPFPGDNQTPHQNLKLQTLQQALAQSMQQRHRAKHNQQTHYQKPHQNAIMQNQRQPQLAAQPHHPQPPTALSPSHTPIVEVAMIPLRPSGKKKGRGRAVIGEEEVEGQGLDGLGKQTMQHLVPDLEERRQVITPMRKVQGVQEGQSPGLTGMSHVIDKQLMSPGNNSSTSSKHFKQFQQVIDSSATPPKKQRTSKKYDQIEKQLQLLLSPNQNSEKQGKYQDSGSRMNADRQQIQFDPKSKHQQQQEHAQRQEDASTGLFGPLDISPIESQDAEIHVQQERISMARGQLQNLATASQFQLSDPTGDGQQSSIDRPNFQDESGDVDAAKQAKQAKEFMNSLQDRLKNLKNPNGSHHVVGSDKRSKLEEATAGSGNQAKNNIILIKTHSQTPQTINKHDQKKLGDSISQSTSIKSKDTLASKNVILDVLECQEVAKNVSSNKSKNTTKDLKMTKKTFQSSSVGPKGEEKAASGSASSNSQKRKQSQPKQGEKGQVTNNMQGLPQNSSSESSGGSQVEQKDTEKQNTQPIVPYKEQIQQKNNNYQLPPTESQQVLPYPRAPTDAAAFLRGEKIQQQTYLQDNQTINENQKSETPEQLLFDLDKQVVEREKNDEAPTSKDRVTDIDVQIDKRKDRDATGGLDDVAGQKMLEETKHKKQSGQDVCKNHLDVEIEAFKNEQISDQDIQQTAPLVENELQSYFQEMNEKANDAMSMQHPEPEKGLELLRQVEDFIKKIQSANKFIKNKTEMDRRKHLMTEVNDPSDHLSPKRVSMMDRAKLAREKSGLQVSTHEQSLTYRGLHEKKRGLTENEEELQFQLSGNEFRNLMGVEPSNLLADAIEDESQIYHTIYRTSPCQFTVGSIVNEGGHTGAFYKRSKTSMSATKSRKENTPNKSLASGMVQAKNQEREVVQPYKIQYTIKQLSEINVDPTIKVILFYNMACCCQRLRLNDECTQYLESSTKALQERIKLLEAQEQSLLHQNFNQNANNLNAVNVLYAPSSRASIKKNDEACKDEKVSQIPSLLLSADLQNFNYRNKMTDLNLKENNQSSEININHIQGSIYQNNDRNLSISQQRASTPGSIRHNHIQTFKYEKLLAQKMQSLRYQCKLHLQICAVLSQQGKHRDALIFGNKSSHLCHQLIKDAQLLCKRQLQQIQRQRQQQKENYSQYDSDESGQDDDENEDYYYDDSVKGNTRANRDTANAKAAQRSEGGIYGNMGGNADGKRKNLSREDNGSSIKDGKAKVHQVGDDESVNSYSVQSGKNGDRRYRRLRQRSGKSKRSLSNSTQNNSSKYQTEKNSPKKLGTDNNQIPSDMKSRQSHSQDSRQRNNIPRPINTQSDLAGGEQLLVNQKLNLGIDMQLLSTQKFDNHIPLDQQFKRAKSRNYQQTNNARSCVSESNRTEQQSSAGSSASNYSSNTHARLKIKKAFENQSRSSGGGASGSVGFKSHHKTRNRFHARDNSFSSQMSQESLKKIYSFALKNAKSLRQLQNEQQKNETLNSAKKQNDKIQSDKQDALAKVYYVEEQVKVLSEIIQMADPILSELSSQIFQFEKLAQRKITYKQRDIELYKRYGKEDFMGERDKLNISFRNLKEIKAIQQVKKFKIAVRNTLGLKQLDDWIYNLNIGNVMHLSLMSADELQPIENLQTNFISGDHSHQNSIGTGINKFRIQSALEIENQSRDGLLGLRSHHDKDDIKIQEKNLFETSHDLCKDAMLEKIVLISVAYFCIATEMRFIIQKQKQQKSMQKKDSEMYHAKALHISSLFLPKECPLVQHITQSYNKNYLKDKQEFNLDRYLTEELGLELSTEEENIGSHMGTERVFQNNIDPQEDNNRVQFQINNNLKLDAPSQQQKSSSNINQQYNLPLSKRNMREMVEQELSGRSSQAQNLQNILQIGIPLSQTQQQQIQPLQQLPSDSMACIQSQAYPTRHQIKEPDTSKRSLNSSGSKKNTEANITTTSNNVDESNRMSSENANDMDEGMSASIMEAMLNEQNLPETQNNLPNGSGKLSLKGNNQDQQSRPVKKVNINKINKSPSINKFNQASFNSAKNFSAHKMQAQMTNFPKRGSLQTVSQPTLSMEKVNLNNMHLRAMQESNKLFQPLQHRIQHQFQGQHSQPSMVSGPHSQVNSQLSSFQNIRHRPPQYSSFNPQMAQSTTLSAQKQLPPGPQAQMQIQGRPNINNRIVPVSKVGLSLGQKTGLSGPHPQAMSKVPNPGGTFASKPRLMQPSGPSSTKHGVQRHFINLQTEVFDDRNSSTDKKSSKGAPTQNSSSKLHPLKIPTDQNGKPQRLNTDGPTLSHTQGSLPGRYSQNHALATVQYLRQSQEKMAAQSEGRNSSPKQPKKKFEGLLNFFYKKD